MESKKTSCSNVYSLTLLVLIAIGVTLLLLGVLPPQIDTNTVNLSVTNVSAADYARNAVTTLAQKSGGEIASQLENGALEGFIGKLASSIDAGAEQFMQKMNLSKQEALNVFVLNQSIQVDQGSISQPVDSSQLALVLSDSDSDGVSNAMDNCRYVFNPQQIDTDFDGFGNACDTDFDNNGGTDGRDFGAFGANFGLPTFGSSLWQYGKYRQYDLTPIPNHNGPVDGRDFGVFAANFGNNYFNPGPGLYTGLIDCALTPGARDGTAPCHDPARDYDSDSQENLGEADNCLGVRNGPYNAANACSTALFPYSCVGNQVDVDLDGFGNACDGDFDNDFDVDLADRDAYLAAEFRYGAPGAGQPSFTIKPGDKIYDLNWDQELDAEDFAILSRLSDGDFESVHGISRPGPSGLACAGSTGAMDGSVQCAPTVCTVPLTPDDVNVIFCNVKTVF